MERYVIRGGRWGAERLAILARSSWASTTGLFDEIGVGPGLRCVDLGCGGGDFTRELARRVGPDGFVVGLDMDEDKLAFAREAAVESGLSNIEFRVSDAYAWSEPDTYDVAYSRLVLQHLSRPVDVVRSMWAAVRVGGVIAIEDADFDSQFCEPPNAAFDFWVTAYQQVLRSHGGDPLSGRKLHTLFAEAGIPDPTLHVVQRVDRDGESKRMPQLTIEATADAIVAEGIATAEQVRAALDGLAALAEDPSILIGRPRYLQAWSRKVA